MGEKIDTSGIYPIKRQKADSASFRGLEALNPALITAYYFFPPERWKTGLALYPRTVTDYELEYALSSEGGRQTIDGVDYPVRQGDVFFRQPGQSTQGFMRYECICLIFSLHGKIPDLADYRINREKPLQEPFGNPAIENLPSVIGTAGNEVFRALFERLMRAFVNPAPCAELLEKGILTEIMYRYLRKAQDAPDDASHVPDDGAGLGPELLERLDVARTWLRENFSRKITVAEIAGRARLSEAYFHKSFVRAFGLTPADYLSVVRLAHARELLAATDMPIRAIAFEAGFENDGYFYRFFAKKTGMTPGTFRNSHRMPGF
jgi:AraC-like DNA-binding protein